MRNEFEYNNLLDPNSNKQTADKKYVDNKLNDPSVKKLPT